MFAQFHTIVVGVDGSAAGFAALEQARSLLAPDGRLVAVVVCEERLAIHAGFEASRLTAEIHEAAAAAREKAAVLLADLPGATTRVVHGRPSDCLLAVGHEVRAELVAVGSHERSRAAGIILGSVASEVLHRAPQSVLVARPSNERHGTIVVGVDGSRDSLAALRVARSLAQAQQTELRPIVAEGADPLALDTLGLSAEPGWEDVDPVKALVDASGQADLVVVGSRGLHGLTSLGSVSERVAHRAPCSVLVVRGAAPPTALSDGGRPHAVNAV